MHRIVTVIGVIVIPGSLFPFTIPPCVQKAVKRFLARVDLRIMLFKIDKESSRWPAISLKQQRY